jgi:hypothetical protein
MNYWMFVCNPKYYKLDERLADPTDLTLTWLVESRFHEEICPGDTAFIWETTFAVDVAFVLFFALKAWPKKWRGWLQNYAFHAKNIHVSNGVYVVRSKFPGASTCHMKNCERSKVYKVCPPFPGFKGDE